VDWETEKGYLPSECTPAQFSYFAVASANLCSYWEDRYPCILLLSYFHAD